MTSGTSVNFNLQLGALPCETFCQWTRIISTLFRRKRHVKPEQLTLAMQLWSFSGRKAGTARRI